MLNTCLLCEGCINLCMCLYKLQLCFTIGEKKIISLTIDFFFLFLQSLIINEIDDGADCENCPSQCPGFKAHEWR